MSSDRSIRCAHPDSVSTTDDHESTVRKAAQENPDDADGADMLLAKGRGREQFGMSESSNDARMAEIATVFDETGKE